MTKIWRLRRNVSILDFNFSKKDDILTFPHIQLRPLTTKPSLDHRVEILKPLIIKFFHCHIKLIIE